LRGWLDLREVGRWLELKTPCWVSGVAEGVATDTRRWCHRRLFFGLKGERFDGSAFFLTALRKGACAAVVSSDASGLEPGVHRLLGRPVFSVADANRAFAQTAAAYLRTLRAKIVAITGSCGKTTTKEMVRKILAGWRIGYAVASHNNMVGVPLTVLNTPPYVEVLLLEFGTNHPGEIAELCRLAPPDVVVITCVAPAHIGNFGSLRALWREKTNIIRHAKKHATAIVGRTPWLHQVPTPPHGRLLRIKDAFTIFSAVEEDERGVVLRLRDAVAVLKAHGSHFADCAALAVTTAAVLGVPSVEGVRRLHGFSPPALRMQSKRVAGVLFVLDCYNANPASVEAALMWLRSRPPRRILIFGGMEELGRFSRRFHRRIGRLAARCADLLVCVGELAAEAAAACRRLGGHAINTTSPDEVVSTLTGMLRPGDTVLFKASRVLRLEEVADLLTTKLEGHGCSGICTA